MVLQKLYTSIFAYVICFLLRKQSFHRVLLLYQNKYDHFFLSSVPSAAPIINITGDVSAFEVYLKFEEVPREYHQGVLIGYHIFYEEVTIIQDCIDGGYNFLANCSQRMRSISRTYEELQGELSNYKPGDIIVDDGLLKTSVDGLLPGVNYTLCVTAFTEVGDGPESCSWAFSQNAGMYCLFFIFCHNFYYHLQRLTSILRLTEGRSRLALDITNIRSNTVSENECTPRI